MTDFKGHNHGEYDDECPICYLDKALDDIIEERDALFAENSELLAKFRNSLMACGMDSVAARAIVDTIASEVSVSTRHADDGEGQAAALSEIDR